MRTVLIVLFDGVQSLDVTGPLEVLASATDHQGNPAYRVRTASLGGAPVRTTSGLTIVPDGDLNDTSEQEPPDLLIVPGGGGTRRLDPDLVAWSSARAPGEAGGLGLHRARFLLAEVGPARRDGGPPPTGPACEAVAAATRPSTVDPDPIFISDGRIATSAGVTAGIDLALALVEDDLGREAALHGRPAPGRVPPPARQPGPVQRPAAPPRSRSRDRCATFSSGSPSTRPTTFR